MAPKKSELPVSLRERVVSLRENGLGYREIGKKVNVCFSTVRYVTKRHKERGSPSNNLRSGRPKKLMKRHIIEEASKNPFVSAITLANDAASTSAVQICARNVLHDAHIYGRSPRKKPLITERNRLKRLEFTKEYINKPIDFWKNVIFSDESKFNIFKSDGRKLVWRKPCTAFHTKNVLPTVKHGGGSVTIWGCMASKGIETPGFELTTRRKQRRPRICDYDYSTSEDTSRLPVASSSRFEPRSNAGLSKFQVMNLSKISRGIGWNNVKKINHQLKTFERGLALIAVFFL
ncbi:transposable element Tc1 transposase [Trichonephila clavipes]|uniref:Transposable element Tc1 transposase n=1 Tax=Trichonephila clavipes TaxID=2585209 RepID=A0A8X6V5P5_TRICX|nr:transposable element Tc1 transposase [Trichonephila clavipes]